MKVCPEVLLVDGVLIPNMNFLQEQIIKGDAKSISIAAASIIAKVTRDRMMVEYEKLYPEYHFSQNKGYGTAEHIEAIKHYGLCPIHRRSFTTNIQ
jgi:ribonuclease HII